MVRWMVASVVAGVVAAGCVPSNPTEPPPTPPTPQLELLSVGDTGQAGAGIVGFADVSADGNRVVFYSDDPTIVAGDANGWTDVFVRDRTAGTTERIVTEGLGQFLPSFSSFADISPSGRYVVASSAALNSPNDTILIDTVTDGRQEWERLNCSLSCGSALLQRSALALDDGQRTIEASCYLRTLSTGDVEFCSGATGGSLQGLFVSSTQQKVGYGYQQAPDLLVKRYGVLDLETGARQDLTAEDAAFGQPSGMSDDGRYLYTRYVNDFGKITQRRVDLSNDSWVEFPRPSHNDDLELQGVSADGRFALVESDATNLVPGEVGVSNVYIWHPGSQTLRRLGPLTDVHGDPATGYESCGMSADGRGACVMTDAPLVAQDTNGARDAYWIQ